MNGSRLMVVLLNFGVGLLNLYVYNKDHGIMNLIFGVLCVSLSAARAFDE